MISASQANYAACTITTSEGKNAANMADGINIILSSNDRCPNNVFEFREQIKAAGLKIETTMVANRGFHNPTLGSFSFFEIVSGKIHSTIIQPGDFFFGHFTTVDQNDELTADQGPTTEPRLMIEAFAWDVEKEVFNFYELIGDGNDNHWFYRGDSADIYTDITLLHRQPDPTHPQFGNRLRCSGCHGAGGPIMKEIHAPHNDWWEPQRKLDFGGRKLNVSIREIVENLVPPDRLAQSVLLGIKRLENSKSTSGLNKRSLQEKLRPLFCPVEVNFMSDLNPNENANNMIAIPNEFFINKKLLNNTDQTILITRKAYHQALSKAGSHFPETTLSDADHAWLTPVKASSDQSAINHLIHSGLIDEKFANDVLSVDMTNPVFSSARCHLLTFVPNQWTDDWQHVFAQHLKSANNPRANELLQHLTNPAHTPAYHQQRAMALLMNCRDKLKNENNVDKLVTLLAQRRAEIKASEISKNRRGQILEPGFRVIFPETTLKPIPEKWMLTDTCEVESASP
jgi:hypothetical protein